MITKAQVKHIQKLGDKKTRDELQLFVVEGEKLVAELISSSYEIESIYCTANWFEKNNALVKPNGKVIVLPISYLQDISFQKTPNEVLAVVRMNPATENSSSKISLLLDGIQDPGNMGSIIRIADWFGINTIYTNPECADRFNPKVVQSSMGSVLRVHVQVCNLATYLASLSDTAVYAAVLDGTPLHAVQKLEKGCILIGNESKGISPALLKYSTQKVTIPRYGHAESLNAAVATGILCHTLLY